MRRRAVFAVLVDPRCIPHAQPSYPTHVVVTPFPRPTFLQQPTPLSRGRSRSIVLTADSRNAEYQKMKDSLLDQATVSRGFARICSEVTEHSDQSLDVRAFVFEMGYKKGTRNFWREFDEWLRARLEETGQYWARYVDGIILADDRRVPPPPPMFHCGNYSLRLLLRQSPRTDLSPPPVSRAISSPSQQTSKIILARRIGARTRIVPHTTFPPPLPPRPFLLPVHQLPNFCNPFWSPAADIATSNTMELSPVDKAVGILLAYDPEPDTGGYLALKKIISDPQTLHQACDRIRLRVVKERHTPLDVLCTKLTQMHRGHLADPRVLEGKIAVMRAFVLESTGECEAAIYYFWQKYDRWLKALWEKEGEDWEGFVRRTIAADRQRVPPIFTICNYAPSALECPPSPAPIEFVFESSPTSSSSSSAGSSSPIFSPSSSSSPSVVDSNDDEDDVNPYQLTPVGADDVWG
ncbi:hypothetical protein B0H16DRAFT_1719738 [Mycena metata]|uniref:Uncharacterized protein n=1 Tax=Mycena metata TaxID=1033252 RepID=A0AAD7NHT6_9AGAR|nr:hypothetical protein B0H16DRAFT_1719738 [Mycena metata]